MRYYGIRSLFVLSLATVSLALSACGEAEPSSSYRIVVQDSVGGEYTLSGSRTSCKLNTSFPEGDREHGKFFVGVVANTDPDVYMSLYVHFLDFTSAPPAGTYANSDSAVDISFSTEFTDEAVGITDDQRDLSNTSVTITNDGTVLTMTIDDGFPGASGSLTCVL